MRLLAAVVLTACALLAASVATATTYEPLSVAIQGYGVVHLSSGASVRCSTPSCPAGPALAAPSRVILNAAPAQGWKLVGWHGACHGARPHCTLKLTRPTRVSVTFAALAKLGSSTDPVPLGKPFAIGKTGWQLTVVSAIPDDTQALLAMTDENGDAINSAPPAGAQDFLASVTATYTGGGSASVGDISLYAIGAHNYSYDTLAYSCGALPPPGLEYGPPVFSGQSVTGNICWQVASNDAASLKLEADAGADPAQGIWFALQ